jgi:hypothetical protein
MIDTRDTRQGVSMHRGLDVYRRAIYLETAGDCIASTLT